MTPIVLRASLALMLLLAAAGCESKSPSGEAEKGGAGDKAADMAKDAQDQDGADGMGGADTAIKAAAKSPGSMENDEGVSHYAQGHYDVAEVHFRKATNADPSLAVAHFNLALALDKLNKHGEATQHFKQALELAPDDPQIAQSQILNAHVGK